MNTARSGNRRRGRLRRRLLLLPVGFHQPHQPAPEAPLDAPARSPLLKERSMAAAAVRSTIAFTVPAAVAGCVRFPPASMPNSLVPPAPGSFWVSLWVPPENQANPPPGEARKYSVAA